MTKNHPYSLYISRKSMQLHNSSAVAIIFSYRVCLQLLLNYVYIYTGRLTTTTRVEDLQLLGIL